MCVEFLFHLFLFDHSYHPSSCSPPPVNLVHVLCPPSFSPWHASFLLLDSFTLSFLLFRSTSFFFFVFFPWLIVRPLLSLLLCYLLLFNVLPSSPLYDLPSSSFFSPPVFLSFFSFCFFWFFVPCPFLWSLKLRVCFPSLLSLCYWSHCLIPCSRSYPSSHGEDLRRCCLFSGKDCRPRYCRNRMCHTLDWPPNCNGTIIYLFIFAVLDKQCCFCTVYAYLWKHKPWAQHTKICTRNSNPMTIPRKWPITPRGPGPPNSARSTGIQLSLLRQKSPGQFNQLDQFEWQRNNGTGGPGGLMRKFSHRKNWTLGIIIPKPKGVVTVELCSLRTSCRTPEAQLSLLSAGTRSDRTGRMPEHTGTRRASEASHRDGYSGYRKQKKLEQKTTLG